MESVAFKASPCAHRLRPQDTGIDIGGWSITCATDRILTSEETTDWSGRYNNGCLPEMVFPLNHLTLHHNASGFKASFTAADALQAVSVDGADNIHVADAEKWKGKTHRPDVQTMDVKSDWTFTTTYSGSISGSEVVFSGQPGENPAAELPVALLQRQMPILWFKEIHLFEDELADNGVSMLSAKIRVMPVCWFVLLRFSLRVDGVLVRIFDTRMFHRFGTDVVLIEHQQREADLKKMAQTHPWLAQSGFANMNEVHQAIKPHSVTSSVHRLSCASEVPIGATEDEDPAAIAAAARAATLAAGAGSVPAPGVMRRPSYPPAGVSVPAPGAVRRVQPPPPGSASSALHRFAAWVAKEHKLQDSPDDLVRKFKLAELNAKLGK